jgi:hypothetical protein
MEKMEHSQYKNIRQDYLNQFHVEKLGAEKLEK